VKRSKPLRRTPLRRSRQEGPTLDREPKPWAPATVKSLHRATYAGGTSGEPIEKDNAIEHEGYRRLVAAMPCKHCGIWGYSQCAHPNTDKAGGKKLIDDRLCFALCTVHPVAGGFVRGCHERFDQGALYTKAARREIEPAWGADTRAAILVAGNWPADLPMLEGSTT
jgi:hypothetical protein